ncbi:MAG TPA: neutral zinc metallopeptidase, partial [Archangium sp.]|uniref:neutral zinc metallopeptidase n=1 Tax=Archangium sp. TaxID=1872627 RepID=UPI002ED9B7D1
MGVGRPLAAGGGIATVVVALVVMLLGGNPEEVLSDGTRSPVGDVGIGGSGRPVDPAQAELTEFVSVILADTEDTWPALLEPQGVRYVEPRLVLFSDAVESACGAQAYVVGHHVQSLLGISERVHAMRRRMAPADANALSVLQELPAARGRPGRPRVLHP